MSVNSLTELDVQTRLMAERDRYAAAIRRHRDYRGDDRCCGDDHELYSVLPEGDTRPARETLVTIENCVHFIACRQTGREYVSPQRRIEELEALVLLQADALTKSEETFVEMLLEIRRLRRSDEMTISASSPVGWDAPPIAGGTYPGGGVTTVDRQAYPDFDNRED